MNKTIKYACFVLSIVAVVLLFVLPCVVMVPILGENTGVLVADITEYEYDSAMSTLVTAIITTSLVALAIIASVCDDFKLAKLSNVAKLLGVLSVLAGIACMVSCIVLTSELNDNAILTALCDISIGFGSFGALIAGVFCCVPVLLITDKKAKKSKKKTTKKKARK